MHSKSKSYGYGNLSGHMVIKDVDTERRTVAGYFASFDNVDSDGDMFVAGAFQKSIGARGVSSTANRKIAHLAFHDTRRPVGDLKTLKEDQHGLYFESEMGSHTDGEDALKMYAAGIIREHSVGFQYIPDQMKWVDMDADQKSVQATEEGAAYMERNNGYWMLNEVKLWEGSYVVFGANSETPSLGVIKTQEQRQEMLHELDERMNLIIKEISTGTYTDNVFPMLEAELAHIQNSYKTLLTAEPSIKDAIKQETEPEDDNSGKTFLLNIVSNKQ